MKAQDYLTALKVIREIQRKQAYCTGSSKPYLADTLKEIIQIILKVVIYALGLIAAYFGVTSLASCSTSHNVVASGRTTIVSVDTTIVKHNGSVRSKNFKPYGEN